MIEEYAVAQIKSLVDNAQTILVICGKPDDAACLATAAAWCMTLQGQGRDARLLSVGGSDNAGIHGTEQLLTELGNENLTISFDYSEEQVDKVSYNISEDNQKFFLTIKPKAGHQPLDTSKVEFSYTGVSADLLIIFGADRAEDLGKLHDGYEELYASASSIVFAENPQFGTVQVPDGEGGGADAATYEIFSTLNYDFSPEVATNLLLALDARTEGLALATNPEVFEQVAQLLRAGGTRSWQAEAAGSERKSGSKKSDAKKDGNSKEITIERKSTKSSNKKS